MEKRRNRPEKYNRELVHKTVKAMERISEVRVTPVCYNNVDPAGKIRQIRECDMKDSRLCSLYKRCSGAGAPEEARQISRGAHAQGQAAAGMGSSVLPSSQLLPDNLSQSVPTVVFSVELADPERSWGHATDRLIAGWRHQTSDSGA